MALDFETSGAYKHSACALGMVRIEDGRITNCFYSLIKPPSRQIWYTHIHGLRWSDLKDAPTFTELWPAIKIFMANAEFLIAHNAPFDRSVLHGCCQAFALEIPPQPFLCTLKGSRKMLKLPSKSLASVSAYFEIDLNHHHAASDAHACGQIFINLLEMGLPLQSMLLNKPACG